MEGTIIKIPKQMPPLKYETLILDMYSWRGQNQWLKIGISTPHFYMCVYIGVLSC